MFKTLNFGGYITPLSLKDAPDALEFDDSVQAAVIAANNAGFAVTVKGNTVEMTQETADTIRKAMEENEYLQTKNKIAFENDEPDLAALKLISGEDG